MSDLRKPKRGEKAELIRELVKAHPDKRPAELAEMFNAMAKERGIKMEATSLEVSQVKYDTRRKVSPNPTTEELLKVQSIARQVGGLAELVRRMDAVAMWER